MGNQTKTPKQIIITVSNRDVNNASLPANKEIAASANAIVVSTAQNICPGGIHLGTKPAVAERYKACSSVKEMTHIPKKIYPILAILLLVTELTASTVE